MRRLLRCALAVAAALAAGAVAANELQVLRAQPASQGQALGHASAQGGQFVVLGAPGENLGAGAAYVFDCSTVPCQAPVRLAPGDLEPGHQFGAAVALSGNTLVVGAPRQKPGVAYVFVADGQGWTQQAILAEGNGSGEDRFAIAVAIEGNLVLVGADGANESKGEAYVFERNGPDWSGPTAIQAANGAPHDGFGRSVAISGGTLLVGAPYRGAPANYAHGAAYVFTLQSGQWQQQAMLQPDPALGREAFGYAVALRGARALIGAPNAGDGQGQAWVFERTGATWTNTAQFTGSNALAGDRFGWSVALATDRAALGAPLASGPGGADCGRAYAFDYSGGAWSESRAFDASDRPAASMLGWSVSADAQRSVAAAPLRPAAEGARAGVAYWYDAAVQLYDSGFEDPRAPCFVAP